MIYALKQCGTSRPSALVRRTDLPNARFPARLDSAESDTTPCGAVVGEKATQSDDAARLVLPSNCSGADAASGRGVRTLRRCTSRTGHWILREPERVGQTHAQCPLSRIFRRHFRPTIELLAWLSVVMALLPTPLWLREVRPALKKS